MAVSAMVVSRLKANRSSEAMKKSQAQAPKMDVRSATRLNFMDGSGRAEASALENSAIPNP
jgi:hypothetical protein